MAAFRLDPGTALGPVHLTVADLERSLSFYCDILGLQARPEGDGSVALSAGPEASIVLLTEKPGATPKPARSTGLYHYAILVPTRRDLAGVIQRFIDTQYPLQGASDHGVSEALYLADPDGNGIEIYRDRPRAEWPVDGESLKMVTEPMRVDEVMATLGAGVQAGSGLPPGTRIGHVHLHVGNLPIAEGFYRDVIGFDLMQRYGGGAAFLSAGGYHHHVGINTWAGAGAAPPPQGSAGLRSFTLVMPGQAAMAEMLEHLKETNVTTEPRDGGVLVRDPSQNAVFITSS